MSRWSTKITTDVNQRIAQGRRSLGKGQRDTTYQHIMRTNDIEMRRRMSKLRAVFRNANQRSRVEVTMQGKWYLHDTSKAINANYYQFTGFSDLLKKRLGTSPSVDVLVEFIVYVMGHRGFTEELGETEIVEKKTSKMSQISLQDQEEEEGWGHGGADAQVTGLDQSEWGDINDVTFSDEEDEII